MIIMMKSTNKMRLTKNPNDDRLNMNNILQNKNNMNNIHLDLNK